MMELESVEQSYGAEVARKLIHLCSLSIPVIYYFITQRAALAILVPLTLVLLVAEVARLYHGPSGRLYERMFGFLLRPHELIDQGKNLTGASYVLISATIGIWTMPKAVFITAFAILIVSDTSEALIGRKFGRHRFFGKTVEGSTAFFLSALLVVMIAPKVQYLPAEYLIGFIGAAAGCLVEAAPLPVDDNLSIPFSIGVIMWGLYILFLPQVNVFALDSLR
jgi:dolichol kinase